MKLTFLVVRTVLYAIGFLWLLLPLILVPAGVAIAGALGLSFYSLRLAAAILPIGMVIYYLVWKYAVAFLNRVVELR